MHPSEEAILNLKDICHMYIALLNFQREGILPKPIKQRTSSFSIKLVPPHPSQNYDKNLNGKRFFNLSPTKSRKIFGKNDGYNQKSWHIFFISV